MKELQKGQDFTNKHFQELLFKVCDIDDFLDKNQNVSKKYQDLEKFNDYVMYESLDDERMHQVELTNDEYIELYNKYCVNA